MKKQILFLLALAISLTSYSQIEFEKGYFIDNSDERFECLIKNMDWNNNPFSFEYKLTDGSDLQTGFLQNVSEFGVYDEYKYYRFTVNIDRSSDDVNAMNDKQNPIYKEEVLFLKILVDGNADLFEYTDGPLKRFFIDMAMEM